MRTRKDILPRYRDSRRRRRRRRRRHSITGGDGAAISGVHMHVGLLQERHRGRQL